MFSKLASLVSLIALATAAPQHQQHATQFPAGVDPARCPGFPICDNAFLHNVQPQQQDHSGQWNPAPVAPAHNQWNSQEDNSGQWRPEPAAPAHNQWNSQEDSGQWKPEPAHNQWNPTPAHNQWNPAPAHNQWNAAPQWTAPATAAPQWAAPQQNWGAAPAASNHLDSTGGDKYPAGVNPQSCPNYPYCDTSAAGINAGPAVPQVAPLPGYTERQYPAGVSPHQCPNFPYCS